MGVFIVLQCKSLTRLLSLGQLIFDSFETKELQTEAAQELIMEMKRPPLFPFIFLIYLVVGRTVFVNSQFQENFKIEEATIQDIQRAFALKQLTSRNLVDFYLNRIETLNPFLRSVIEVNPEAQNQAEEADRIRERHSNNNSEMLGIPVLLKDSIATKDKLNTTAGSYALLGSKVPRDAGVVRKLREAGAVILGKASMSEWYRMRSLSISEGWCARTGQAKVSDIIYLSLWLFVKRINMM